VKKNCKYNELIDEYLLNRLDLEQKNKFEEHYFNCRSCFSKLQAREKLISIIKLKGDSILSDNINAPESLWDRLFTRLPLKQIAFFAISAGMLIFLILTFYPTKKTAIPEFRLDDPHLMRGKSITLFTDALPVQFKWESLGENIEYQITIFDQNVFWETTTKNNSVLLPKNIKSKMKTGIKYYWQVKAYSQTGTLIAKSDKIQLPAAEHK